MNEHLEAAPTTIKEVGIYIGFMRQDIANLSQTVKDMPSGFATAKDLLELTTRVQGVEQKGFKVSWVYPSIAAIVATIMSSVFTFLVIDYLQR